MRHCLLLVLVLAACGSGSDGPGDTDTDSGIDVPADHVGDDATPPPSSCPDRADPVDLVDPVEAVGDGTSGSCTETALRTAVDALNAGSGGSITFDCGGTHTITLTSPLLVDATSSWTAAARSR